MKILLNKLKKVNKIFLIITTIIFIIYSFCYGIFLKNLLNLEGIENLIRYIILSIFFIWGVIYLISSLINLILKKHLKLILITLITIILTVILGFVNYYINVLFFSMDNLSESEYVTYTSNLVVLNETAITKKSKLGMISSSEDIEGNILAKKLIEQEKLKDNEVINYTSYYEMIFALLNKDVEGIFLNNNYLTIFNEEEFAELKNTKILYSFKEKMKNKDKTLASNKDLTEPITILLMGVDSEGNGIDNNASFNGDTLMLLTFNPKTLNATMFSIPRDTYVPIACNSNRYHKINSSAAYGTNCVIDTIENLTGIGIDYYVKINFKGVVELVEALGGVDVEVEAPNYQSYINMYNGRICEQDSLRQFGDNLICMDSGMQHLDGEQTLAYARCRHAYLQSDIARNKHQQQIIEALAKKMANPENIYKLEEILNAVTNNLATNMSQKQMLSFYNILKNMIAKSFKNESVLSIKKTYLEYYNLPVRLGNNGMVLSAIGYYPGSLEQIVKVMKENLELEKKEVIKSFSFNANEIYVQKPIGQGITTGTKLETMPNFVGLPVKEAENWALNHNITLETVFVDSNSEFYNPTIALGVIANQSVNSSVLINNLTDLTIYINKTGGNNSSTNENNNSNNENNNNNTEVDNNDNQNNNDDPINMFLPNQNQNSTEKPNQNEENTEGIVG